MGKHVNTYHYVHMTIGGFNPFSRFHQILNTILLFSLRRDTIDTSTSSLSILSISDSGCLWQTKRTHTRKTHMLNLHMLNLHMLPSVPLVPLVTPPRHATPQKRNARARARPHLSGPQFFVPGTKARWPGATDTRRRPAAKVWRHRSSGQPRWGS